MSSPYSALAGKVRAKFPGQYDDLSDDDLGKKVIAKHPEYQDLVTMDVGAQVKAATPKTSTKPFFEPPPAGTPFPPTNPIEKAGQRLDLLGQREQHAMQSPTPVTNAAAIFAPVGAARQVVESKVGAAVGRKVAPYIGVDPETAEVAGGALFNVAAEGVGKVSSMPKPTVKLKSKFSVGPIQVDRNIPPPPETPESLEETASQRTAQKLAQRASDEKAGLVRPRAQVEAEKQAKVHEASMNKEAGEHDAIRKRYESERNAQTRAEQVEQAHREKLGRQRMQADAAQQKFHDDMEKANQAAAAAEQKLQAAKTQREQLAREKLGKQRFAADKAQTQYAEAEGARRTAADTAQGQAQADQIADLDRQIKTNEAEVNKAHADRERLNDQWASALNRRGKDLAPLEKEAERLAGETQKATQKATTTKTELGQRLAKLNDLRVKRANAEAMAGGPSSVSPDVWKELSPEDKARIVARYHNTTAQARERGMVSAARGATGPQLSNDVMRTRTGFGPPPEP
jgi:hypothetical protein